MKQAACGGTGCAVLNGETLLWAVHGDAVRWVGWGAAQGPLESWLRTSARGREGSVAVGRSSLPGLSFVDGEGVLDRRIITMIQT